MADLRITLPKADEIMRRLVAVNDMAHYRQKLYPLIQEAAGRTLAPRGVGIMLMLAFADYTDGLPPTMEDTLYTEAPSFIDALVDDPVAATEIKNFLTEATLML